ncbi:MAG: hypothetical protein QOH32_2420 [Bradyrhizobium sp.]|jgi:hypothetical protein|nr:hypothetical protein [Bradyrhizobium sp.]
MPKKYLYGPGVHIRHDWQRWIRPDFARWIKPGVDPADVIPALARERAERQAADERARAAEDAELAAEIEHERRVLAALSEEMKEVHAEMARWRRRLAEEEAKYSPDQPRVPAGNPRGGRWTDRSGGQGTVAGPSQDRGQATAASLAQPMGNVGIGDVSGSSETERLFNIGADAAPADSANSSAGVLKVAAADETGPRYSVNLEEEDARGGHAKSKHVGKTDRELIDVLNADYVRKQSGNLEITDFRREQGSFTSLEQANDLVNRVLEMNKDKVDGVATGKKREATLQERFDFVTGKEAFRPNGDSEPYIRATDNVRVVIRPDNSSWRGYRVHTAYPVNDR